MKYLKIFLILFLFLIPAIGWSAFGGNFAWAESIEEQAYVLYIIDGDTIGVSINGKEERVRLIGIDAPEIANKEKNTEAECYADESTKKLKDLILNKNVKLISDNISNDRDKYNRLLRYIYLDNLDINAELIKNGHARAYLFFGFDKQEEYKNLAQRAELENLGLYDLDICKENFLEIDNPAFFGASNIYYLIILIIIFLFIIIKKINFRT